LQDEVECRVAGAAEQLRAGYAEQLDGDPDGTEVIV
jgi:hypothetical protein